MKNVLVTGSLGYIGTELVPFLNKKGKNTIGLDPGFFKDCTLYSPKRQRTILKDVRNITYDNLSDIDVVVHLAGISNDPFGNLKVEQVYDPTYQYSMRLADMCKKLGIKMIFPSSCSVYGKSLSIGNMLNEKSSTNPQTPYSSNKLQIEDGLKEKANKDFKPIMLRFATVFGPSARMRFDLFINMFAGMIVTNKEIVLNSNGAPWRPSVYIEDILNAVDYAVDFEPDRPLVLNVGHNDNNYRVIDIAEMFTELVPNTKISFIKDKKMLESKEYELVKDKKIQDGVDTRTYKVSFEEVSKVFTEFECKYTVKEGIKKLLKTLIEKKLDEAMFKNRNFYRLQKFDYLLETEQITNQIYWRK